MGTVSPIPGATKVIGVPAASAATGVVLCKVTLTGGVAVASAFVVASATGTAVLGALGALWQAVKASSNKGRRNIFHIKTPLQLRLIERLRYGIGVIIYEIALGEMAGAIGGHFPRYL